MDYDFFSDVGGVFDDIWPQDGGFNDLFDEPCNSGEQPVVHRDDLSADFGYSDSSLAVPVREQQYLGTEPPQLSPVRSYDALGSSYDPGGMSMELNSQGYNSFEQPSMVVMNGEYTHPVDDPPIQHNYYQEERPSTSSHQPKVNYSSTPATSRSSQPAQCRSQPQPSRQRQIQPKPSGSSRKRGNDHQQQQQQQTPQAPQNGNVSVRVSADDLQAIGELTAQMNALKSQEQHGIDNSQELKILEANLLKIFSRNGAPVVPTPPAPAPPQPARSSHSRSSRPPPPQQQQPVQNHHTTVYETTPSSSSYQPVVLMSRASTSQATHYQQQPEYQQPPTMAVHHQTPVTRHQTSSGPVYRVVQQPQHHQQQQPSPHQPQQQHQQPIHVQQQQPSSSYQQGQAVYVRQTHSQQIVTGQVQRTVGEHVKEQLQLQKQNGQLRHVIVQQPVSTHPQHVHHQHQQQMQPPHLIAQPPVILPPPRQTAAQVERQCEERKAMRRKRVNDYLASMARRADDPETERPFSDLGDVLHRLLPYHGFLDRDLKEAHMDFIDANILRANINNNERVKHLQRRMRKVFFDEAARVENKEEQNLLLFLDTEYEKRKLEEERAAVNDSTRVEFVHRSELIPALREAQIPVSHPTPSSNPPKFVNHYEYNPFTEVHRSISPCKSPYLMSPTSSTRSHSPVKSPLFHSPRLRVRSTNSSSSSHVEPVHQEEPVAVRKTSSRTLPEMKPPMVKVEPMTEVVKKTAGEDKMKRREAAIHRNTNQQEIPAKQIKRETVSPVKAPVKPSPKAPKIEEPEPEPFHPTTSDAATAKLPAKKAFLSRVRNAIPPALRSPPAQMVRPPMANGIDSDGSCSPELGMDDFPSVPSTPVVAKQENKPTVSTLPSPLKKLAPLPPPLPKKSATKEKKKEAEVPEKKIKVKIGPPPPSHATTTAARATKNSVKAELKPVVKQEEKATAVETPVTEKRPPIKLKLKIGGDNVLIVEPKDKNENVLKEEKKRKKEKKRRKREEHEKKREERLRLKALEEAGTSSPREDAVIIPTQGLKFKILFGQGRSRTATPIIPADEPSTSKANGTSASSAAPAPVPSEPDPQPPRKLPKLKIRLGRPPPPAVEPKVEVAPAVAPVTRPTTNGPAVPPTLSATMAAGSAQGALPAVNFSDQSDSEGERLRSTTDETLRSWGMGLNMKPLQTPPLLPFSSHP